MLRIVRQILIPAVFLAAAVWVGWKHSLLLNCALWLALPVLLTVLGERRGFVLLPAIAAAAWALGLAGMFLYFRELAYPRYALRSEVEAQARSTEARVESLVPYAGEVRCGEEKAGRICRDFAGQRIFPAATWPGKEGVLFLGGSVTDAGNVPDDSAFPFVAAKLARRPFRSVAEGGAGMNTMLFRLEHSESFLPKDFSFTTAVYTFVPRHVARAAGLGDARFARSLPHYELVGGRPALSGTHFSAHGGEFWVRKLGPEMFFYFASLVYPAQGAFSHSVPVSPEAIALAAAQVNEMGRVVREKHGAKLVVNVWPGLPFPEREAFFAALERGTEIWAPKFTGAMDDSGLPDAAFQKRMGEYLGVRLSGR